MGVRSLLEEPEDVKTYDVQQEHGRVDRTHLDGVSVIKETVNNENTYIVYMYVYSYIYMYDYTPVYIYIYLCVCFCPYIEQSRSTLSRACSMFSVRNVILPTLSSESQEAAQHTGVYVYGAAAYCHTEANPKNNRHIDGWF